MKQLKKFLIECRTITVDSYEVEASSKKEAIEKFYSTHDDDPTDSEDIYEGIHKIKLLEVRKGNKSRD